MSFNGLDCRDLDLALMWCERSIGGDVEPIVLVDRQGCSMKMVKHVAALRSYLSYTRCYLYIQIEH